MKPVSRRDFLKGSAAAAGFTIAASVTPFGYSIVNASEVGKGTPEGFEPNAWFRITPDNVVTVHLPNSEMGQGVMTALPMIVADELEASWSQVRVKQAPAAKPFINPLLQMQITVASCSVRAFYEPLRAAGAAGRMMLVTAAAQTWNVPEGECEASDSAVHHKKSGRTVKYGELCAKAATLPVPDKPALKTEAQFKYIGKAMPRLDIPDKVSGKAVFGADVVVPDMLYAVIERPPAYGAKTLSHDQKAAEAVKGVRGVFAAPDSITVCAETLNVALKGRAALAAKWDAGSHPDLSDESIEKHFKEGLDKPGAVAAKTGDTPKALNEAQKRVTASYYVPFVAHATMEPMNCTAHVQNDRCDVWAPTQGQTIAQLVASKVSGLPTEKVHIHTTYLGCGLGRRATPDFVAQAVGASKAAGKPVQVFWTREDDIKYDFYRGATCQKIEAGLDAQGRVVGWSHKVSCSSILKFLNPAGIKDGVDLYSLWGIVDNPNAPTLNNTAYKIPNFYVEQYLSDLPIPCNPWRSVQNAPNAFVMECFMDELAHSVGQDPVQFRMHLLTNNMRARRVIETAAEKAGWGKPAPKGKGRGFAQHTCFGTYVAQVADISVNDKTGAIKVDKIVAAVDCGPVVNPDPLIAQIEGAVILALSTTLKEQVKFAAGGPKSANFDDYHIIRMSETPDIEVHVVKSTEKIGGIGEPGVPPVAPAVANALFNATGVRVRRIPLDPPTVLAALKKKGA